MRIAVVGAGIAGLVASHVLARRHQVTLFEAEATAGGHANTVAINDNGRQRPIDTGFIVFNRENYPLLTRFFEYLNVPNHQSDMSFSVSCEKTNFEYSGTSMNGFFSQRQNIMNPKHWMLLADILRFNSQAEHWFRERADPSLTVAQFIRECPLGKSFAEYYLLPLGSSLWSCHPRRFERFPMKFVIEFLKNHAMLQVRHRPQWLTVAGGSRCYVNAVTSQLPAGLLRLQNTVDRVVPRKGGVDVSGMVQTVRLLTKQCWPRTLIPVWIWLIKQMKRKTKRSDLFLIKTIRFVYTLIPKCYQEIAGHGQVGIIEFRTTRTRQPALRTT